MIISHKHKFIFIKTAKTAGSSIEIALSKICGSRDIITYKEKESLGDLSKSIRQNVNIPFKYYSKKDWRKLLRERTRKQFKGHDSALSISQNIDDHIWNNYYKFCFERNPYDKFISWYYWCGGPNRFGTMKNFIQSGIAGDVKGKSLYCIDDKIVVDEIYKFEDIDSALSNLREVCSITDEIKMPKKKFKGVQRKDQRHYSEVLGDYEKEWITKNYSFELEQFNYEF
ncbi:sulfotransferase family 2 domain-containing protein [Psychroflexus salinarum]|uniref:Sulfotransferase family 2 domain-containing protein n=1 Tax=Psychroflexus salinarum TaxID=546024 RepID=A0ABW3GSR3_9FLAO